MKSHEYTSLKAMRYRSRIDIISGILQVTSGEGATRNRIMYGVYLSYHQAKEYLGFLMEKRLVAYEQGAQRYRTTEDGARFLRAAERLEDLLGVEPEAQQDKAPFSLR
jgi:predicted transcriptional regulator